MMSKVHAAVPDFRVIVIADCPSRIERAIRLWERHPAALVAVMLRDADHRHSAVEALGNYAVEHCPAGMRVISNGAELPGVPFVHLPSSFVGSASPVHPFGASTHDERELDDALAAGASWVTYSPVFASTSKPGLPGAGLDWLRNICQRSPRPVFALGGIDAARVASCFEAGAWGIAAITAFDDPEHADRLLKEVVRQVSMER